MGNEFAVSVRMENGNPASLSLQSTCRKKHNVVHTVATVLSTWNVFFFFEHGPEAVDSLRIGQGHQEPSLVRPCAPLIG